jgi:hypothetical protein
MTVVILEDAAEDLESGAQFYESCATGVGDYFLDSILSDLDSLVLFAGVHPIYFGFHRMLSKRFPFGIYYEVEDEVVYVYAILDLRRDPSWIRNWRPVRESNPCRRREREAIYGIQRKPAAWIAP